MKSGKTLPEPKPVGSVRGERLTRWCVPALFLLLTVIQFGSLLFQSARVLGAPDTDMVSIFLPLREFSFGRIRQGHIPLWNPHLFGGVPHVAGFQSAVYYPPNWLHVLLPSAAAMNWNYAAHVFLAGYLTYLWARYRETSVFGAVAAGVTFMFCGPYFLHIFAGHVIHVQAMTWMPLIFLAVDGLVRTGGAAWALVGAAAVGMQILSGSPQYVYYTGLCVLVYGLLRFRAAPFKIRLALGLGAIYLGGVALAAMQFVPSVAARDDLLRSGGLPLAMASTFRLHPHGLLTVVAPYGLGGMRAPAGHSDAGAGYFGPGYLWELCLYVGVASLVLAVFGAVFGRRPGRVAALGVVAVASLLALGAYTPLYAVLYHHLPWYDHFRSTAKFGVVITLFLSLFAGWGLDALTEFASTRPALVMRFGIGVAAVALGLAIGGYAVLSSARSDDGFWAGFLKSIPATEDFYLIPASRYETTTLIRDSARQTSGQLYQAAGLMALVAVVCLVLRSIPFRAWVLAGMVAVEMSVFAFSSVESSPAVIRYPDTWQATFDRHPGDYRAICLPSSLSNVALVRGQFTLWGYDPIVVRRYAQFMAHSQGFDPDEATQYLEFRELKPFDTLYPMLRCRYFMTWDGSRGEVSELSTPTLPHALLVYDRQVIRERDGILQEMDRPTFDPRRQVLLEEPPSPEPAPTKEPGTVELVSQTTDTLEFRIHTPEPAVLLVTDVYSSGWRVRPLAPGPQAEYQVMPANYCLRAVPLAAGEHHILMEYRPTAVVVGRWVSGVSALCMMLTVGWLWRRKRLLSPLAPASGERG